MSTEDCRLCLGIQSIAESDLVKEVIEKKELTIETMLTGMRDAMVLGWTLRDMQGAVNNSVLCDEHANAVNAIMS